jgi:hypothetical protein
MALSYDFIASYTAPSNQNYITFNNIPSTYTHLYLKGNQRSTRNGGDDGSTQYFYNNSQSANYNYASVFQYNASGLQAGNAVNQTYNNIEGIPQVAGSGSDFYGGFELFIPNYVTGSRYHPSLAFGINTRQASPGGIYAEGAGQRYVTDAITRIDLMTDVAGAQFVTGSSYYLYGIKNA